MRSLLLLAILAFALWKGYGHFKTPEVPVVVAQAAPSDSPAPTAVFHCDGRQHCSQMRSRAEAEYFVGHCPDTKMDGDHDRVPCENDSRF